MHRQQGGVAFLGVLFLIAVGAVSVAGQGAFSALDGQREREDELLFIGAQFRQAIASYHESTPGPVKRYPESLDDLLLDRRFAPARRHLRRIYLDPIKREKGWGEVKAPEGGVMGVFSLSRARPIKQAGFMELDRAFNGKARCDQWVFMYQGGQTRYTPARMMPMEPAGSQPDRP